MKSLSRVWLFVTPWTVASQAPLSIGFFSKSTGVGCYFLLQEIVSTQGLNPGAQPSNITCYMIPAGNTASTAQASWPLNASLWSRCWGYVVPSFPWVCLFFYKSERKIQGRTWISPSTTGSLDLGVLCEDEKRTRSVTKTQTVSRYTNFFSIVLLALKGLCKG